jgi:hypothetical protein
MCRNASHRRIGRGVQCGQNLGGSGLRPSGKGGCRSQDSSIAGSLIKLKHRKGV